MLVVEKYTSLEYSKRNGNLSNLSPKRLAQLQRSHDEHQRTRNFAIDLLEKNGIEYRIVKDDEVSRIDYSEFDSVMSLGGDGTALHAISYMTDQLFFGVNTDRYRSIGKLTRLNIQTLEAALNRAQRSNESVTYWDRIYARVNGKRLPWLAVNEILAGDPRIYKTTHLQIEAQNRMTDSVSNGVIIATSQGSGAFYKSSGASPFDVSAIGYNVIMPYSLEGDLDKSGLIGIDEKIIIRPKREHYQLMFDCQENRSINLSQGDEIEIGACEKDRLRVVV